MSDDGSSKSVTFEDALNSHWDFQEAAMASVRQARVGSSGSSSMLYSHSSSPWCSAHTLLFTVLKDQQDNECFSSVT
jgi:hypothetical protein